MLAQEFQILASMRHPHVISVLDYGFDKQQQPFFTMDLLENAQTVLEAGQACPVIDKIHYIVQILQALHYLHRRNIIHQDIKPANVLVSQGQVKVLDFGLASHRSQDTDVDLGQVRGTPMYMAPEVFQGAPAHEASDLYSVGIIAYELLTDHHPFNTQTFGRLLTETLNKPPDLMPFMEIETGKGVYNLSTIIGKLLAKTPEDRYSDASEVIHDFSCALDEIFPTETVFTRESFLQTSPLVGREIEQTRLKQNLQDAIAGNGKALFITGEGGVGKSRLLKELRTQALVNNTLVVRGQATQHGQPYQIWLNPLRRLVLELELSDTDASILKTIIPDIDQLIERSIPAPMGLTPEESQKRLLDAVLSVIHRQNQPIVMIIEDLHLIGGESLAILSKLIETIEDFAVLIVGSYRSDTPSEINKIVGENLLELKRLSHDAIQKLVVNILGEAGNQEHILKYLERETEGNVFFLTEILRALAEDAGQLSRIGQMEILPENLFTGGVQQIIQGRLDRVPRLYYPALQIAAVLGRQVDLKVLKAAAPNTDVSNWLTACVNAAVIEPHDQQWRFTHEKLREGVNITASESQLQQIHRQAALALESIYPDHQGYAAALTNHWQHAGDRQKELYYATIAAEHAYQIGADHEGIYFFNRVLALLPDEIDPQERLSFQRNIVELQARVGELDAAQTSIEQILTQIQADTPTPFYVKALSTHGNVLLSRGHPRKAIEQFQKSLDCAKNINDSTQNAGILISLGDVSLNLGEYAQAKTYYIEGLAASWENSQVTHEAKAYNALGRIEAVEGNFEAAVNCFNQGLKLWRQLGNKSGTAQLLMNLGNIAAMQGDFEQALIQFGEGLTLFRELNSLSGIASCVNNLGMIAFMQQNYQSAYSQFIECLSLFERIGDQFNAANAHTNLGHATYALNKVDHAMMHFSEGIRIAKQIEAMPILLEALAGIAKLYAQREQWERTEQIAQVILSHASNNPEIQSVVAPLLEHPNLNHLKEKSPLESPQNTLDTLITLILQEADYG
jgi:serine/threonine protein kinase/tetratricopeptide (TPR) repeat protein